MALPLKVLNRLRLGRNVAAAVPALYPDYRAWVHVEPLVSPDATFVQGTGYGSEKRLPATASDAIKGYKIRYIRIQTKYLEHEYDLDLAWEDDLTLDETIRVADEAELVQVLSQWLNDLSALRVPSIVHYPLLPKKPT